MCSATLVCKGFLACCERGGTKEFGAFTSYVKIQSASVKDNVGSVDRDFECAAAIRNGAENVSLFPLIQDLNLLIVQLQAQAKIILIFDDYRLLPLEVLTI